MMDLTAAEAVLIDFMRGVVASDFNMTIATSGGEWLVTAASPSDGFLVGRGNSFGEAFSAAMGADPEPGGDPGDGETVPAARALRVVAGIDHQSEQSKAAA